jgi:hypothetical protein
MSNNNIDSLNKIKKGDLFASVFSIWCLVFGNLKNTMSYETLNMKHQTQDEFGALRDHPI